MPGALPCFLAPPLLPILAAGMDEMAEHWVGRLLEFQNLAEFKIRDVYLTKSLDSAENSNSTVILWSTSWSLPLLMGGV